MTRSRPLRFLINNIRCEGFLLIRGRLLAVFLNLIFDSIYIIFIVYPVPSYDEGRVYILNIDLFSNKLIFIFSIFSLPYPFISLFPLYSSLYLSSFFLHLCPPPPLLFFSLIFLFFFLLISSHLL